MKITSYLIKINYNINTILIFIQKMEEAWIGIKY